MSDDQQELDDGELDDLLADLESRADGQGTAPASAAASDADDQDIEQFLNDLDGAEAESTPTKTADAGDDEFDERFAQLDDMAPDDLPAKTTSKEPSAAESADTAPDPDADKSGHKDKGLPAASRGRRIAKRLAKMAVLALPVAALVWLLGAYLAQWVSAGWLIAAMALIFALGAPLVVNRLVGKGRFSWWAAGIGLALTVALTAPIPSATGKVLVSYGHWPATAVSEVAGWDVDNAFVQLTSGMAAMVGGAFNPATSGPQELGTDHPLYGEPRQPAGNDAVEPARPTPTEQPNIPK